MQKLWKDMTPPLNADHIGGAVVSSIHLSQILGRMPKAVFDFVFVAPELLEEGRTWLHENLEKILCEKEPS